MENATQEKKVFWYNRFDFLAVAILFLATIKKGAFNNARLVFNGKTRTVRGRTEYSPNITEYGFEVVCDINDHIEIPGHRFVGIAVNKGPGWIVTNFTDDFEFTKEVVDSLDPQRCDVCGRKRDRVRLMILENTDTKELVIVGGSCAKNFKNVNLEDLVRKMTIFSSNFGCMDPDELGGFGGGGRRILDLVESIAVGELLISRLGYTSRKKADVDFTCATSDLIGDYFSGNGRYYESVKAVMDRSRLDLAQRIKELTNGGLKALKAHFERANERRWSEFNSNMVVWLSCQENVPLGVAAYLAFANLENAQKSARTDQKVTGFDGAPIKKMSDFGWFKVVSVKAKENTYSGNIDFCFTCLNADSQKLWFKVGEDSVANRAFDQVVPGDWIDADQEAWINVRGKLTQTKSEIAFASHIKFKKVEIRTI